MVNYPAQIDTSISLPTVVDNFTPVQGSVFNKLRDAVIAIESELGVKPSGTNATVTSRLSNLENTISNLQIIKIDQDLGGTLLKPLVIGIQGRPVSSAPPGINEVITWDGIAWTPLPPMGVVDVTLGGDLSGTKLAQYIASISGNNGTGGVVPLHITTLQFTSDQVSPTLNQATLSGTGINNGNNLSITAQAGRNQSGVNNNNNGGNLVLSSGSAGVGGSGAAGVAGNIQLKTDSVTQLLISPTSTTLTGSLVWASGSAPTYGNTTITFATDANKTLLSSEYNNSEFLVRSSPSLTATRDIIVPSIPGASWTFYNSTGGGQSIRIINSGLGFIIANGMSANVWTDGINVYGTSSGGLVQNGSNAWKSFVVYPFPGQTNTASTTFVTAGTFEFDPTVLTSPNGTRTIKLRIIVESTGPLMSIQLFNITTTSIVTGSLMTTSSAIPVLLTTGDLTSNLTAGPAIYQVQIKIASAGPADRVTLDMATIKVDWS